MSLKAAGGVLHALPALKLPALGAVVGGAQPPLAVLAGLSVAQRERRVQPPLGEIPAKLMALAHNQI